MIGEQARGTIAGAESVSVLPGLEPLYTAAEVAGYLKLDETTVRRLFLDRPDVVKLGRTEARAKRSYVTLRIPLSAVQKFIRERSR
jgi:hypothetical protein